MTFRLLASGALMRMFLCIPYGCIYKVVNMIQKAAALAGLMLLLSVPAQAGGLDVQQMLQEMATIEKNSTLLEAALKDGRDRAMLCVHCHGEDGNSKRDYIPNLASQNSEYLLIQFEHFADGTRKDYVMSKLAKNLTANDRVDVALYFSHQSVKTRPAAPAGNVEKGKQLYNSVCFACHGREGHGNAMYPRIAGQPYEFVNKTLLRFLHNDPERQNSPMMSIIKNMNEEQLRNVASYVSSMP